MTLTVVLAGAAMAAAFGLAYIRGASSDPARWHVQPKVRSDADLPGGVVRSIPAGQGRFAALHRIIETTPKTSVLAGSVADKHLTYVTRSKWIGFPDYTTMHEHNGQIVIWARLRFGRIDFGVNKARVDRWLTQLSRL